MKTGQKHLIKCRCVLPQFKNLNDPTQHHFIVFSTINENGDVDIKYSQCNNCGVIHKVIDICRSEIQSGKENMNSLLKIEDLRPSLHNNYLNILEANNADLPTWEAVQFAIENKLWGSIVILTTDNDQDVVYGKFIKILGESLCKVENFTRSAGLI